MKGLVFFFLALIGARAGYSQAPAAQPITIGTTHTLHSTVLHQHRKLNVYTPPVMTRAILRIIRWYTCGMAAWTKTSCT